MAMVSEASIADILRRAPPVAAAWLFGSRARGRERPDSDWDVAVLFESGLDVDARFRERVRLAAELGEAVDLVVLDDAPPLLALRGLQGRLLLDRDPVRRVRFSVRTLGAAEDERYFARIHAEAREKRLREGRFGRP